MLQPDQPRKKLRRSAKFFRFGSKPDSALAIACHLWVQFRTTAAPKSQWQPDMLLDKCCLRCRRSAQITSECTDDVPAMLAFGRASVGGHPRGSVVQFGGLIERLRPTDL
jgi:hypothetical protein